MTAFISAEIHRREMESGDWVQMQKGRKKNSGFELQEISYSTFPELPFLSLAVFNVSLLPSSAPG